MPKAIRVIRVALVCLETLVLLVLKARKDHRVLKDQLEHKGRKALPVTQEQLDCKDRLVPQDSLDFVAQLGLLALLGQ